MGVAASDHPQIPLVDGHVHAPAGMTFPNDLKELDLFEGWEKKADASNLKPGEYCALQVGDDKIKYSLRPKDGQPVFSVAKGRPVDVLEFTVDTKKNEYVYEGLNEFVDAFAAVNKLFDQPKKLEKILNRYIDKSSAQGCVLAEIQINPAIIDLFPAGDEATRKDSFRRALEKCRDYGESKGMSINYLAAYPKNPTRSMPAIGNNLNTAIYTLDLMRTSEEFKRPLFAGVQAGGPEDTASNGNSDIPVQLLLMDAKAYEVPIPEYFAVRNHASEIRDESSIREVMAENAEVNQHGEFKNEIAHCLSFTELEHFEQDQMRREKTRIALCPKINCDDIGFYHKNKGKEVKDAMKNHPIAKIHRAAPDNTVLGTDNPGFINGFCGDQVVEIMDAFGKNGTQELSWRDIMRMQINAVATAALPQEEKKKIFDRMELRLQAQLEKQQEYTPLHRLYHNLQNMVIFARDGKSRTPDYELQRAASVQALQIN